MIDERTNKIYNLYEILNDFNRLTILINLYDKELSIEDIAISTKFSVPIINHQLEYLKSKKVVSKNNDLYKITDKTLEKLIYRMIAYIDSNK